MVFGVHVEKSDQLQEAGTRSQHRHKKPYLPGRAYFWLTYNNLNEKFQYIEPRENYRPLYFCVVFGVHPPVTAIKNNKAKDSHQDVMNKST